MTDVKPKPKAAERGPYKKTTKRLEAAALLMDAGMKPIKAIESLGYSKNSIDGIRKRIKEQGLAEFVTKKRVKSATKVIETFMSGRPVGRIEEEQPDGTVMVIEEGVKPKDSTVLAAANTVLDRAYPKAQEHQAGDTYNFIKVDLTEYRNPPTSPEIDITPEKAVGNGG